MTLEKNIFYALFGLIWYLSAFLVVINGQVIPKTGEFYQNAYVKRNISCPRPGYTTGTISGSFGWDNKKVSLLQYATISQRTNGILVNTYTGNVTHGQFSRSTFRIVISFPNVTTGCSTLKGMLKRTGTGVGIIGNCPLNSTLTITYSPGITNTIKPTIITQSANITLNPPLGGLC